MKALQITQIVVVVLVAVYLWVFHTVNQDYLALPLLPSMPPAVVVLVTIALTWLATWAPAQARIWRLKRRLRAIAVERDALATAAGPHVEGDPGAPVIPDRIEPIDPYATGSDSRRRGDDPTDYL